MLVLEMSKLVAFLSVLTLVLSTSVSAQLSASVGIEWEVKSRFRLFNNEADFIDVKKSMGEIIARLDHVFLNDIAPFDVKNPSAENIAEYFHAELSRRLTGNPVPVELREVRVWETDIQSAAYRP